MGEGPSSRCTHLANAFIPQPILCIAAAHRRPHPVNTAQSITVPVMAIHSSTRGLLLCGLLAVTG
ncbi:hypothetical protein G3N88_21725, partial [Xanthomonas hortorum pv. gardneri]